MENENEEQDFSTSESELDTNQEVEETTYETPDEVDVDELRKKAELANNYKIRAEKAEAEAKKLKQTQTQPKPEPKLGDLSQTDMLAVLRAGVPDEDLEEVQDYARLKRITVSEALKAPLIKASLAEKEEQRKTAQATNTGASKRGTSKASDEALMSRAEKGDMPESEDDIARLWRMRHGK